MAHLGEEPEDRAADPLDTSGSTSEYMVPHVVSGDGYMAWAEYSGGTPIRQKVWKVGTARAQTVPLDLTSGPFQHAGPARAIAGGKLIYVLPAKSKAGRVYGAGNCWSYPIDGKGKAQQLTHSGLVEWCWVSDGTDLVWTEMSAGATNADPHALKTMNIDGTSEPRTVHDGGMSAHPLVGDGFALWFSGKATNASALRSTASTAFDGGDLAWQGAADGHLVVYPGGSKRLIVTVIRVAVSGP